MTKFITTKKQCAKSCVGSVCPGCGNPIVPIKTVDNAGNPTYWSGCEKCSRFTYGTTPLLFRTALIMANISSYKINIEKDASKEWAEHLLREKLFELQYIVDEVLDAYEKAKQYYEADLSF